MTWIDEPVLVHVGLHKTATSWLQQHYFPIAGNGFWVPPVPGPAKYPVKQIGYMIVSGVRGRLMTEDEFDSGWLREILSGFDKPAGEAAVISNERLAGHPDSNGFDREMLARRIKAVFPKARVLVTIREQNSIIMSNYMQYLKNGGWHTPERYLQPFSDTRQPVLTLQYWNYDRLVSQYVSIFGPGDVLVLPQEMLRTNPREFLRRIAAFAGVAPPRTFATGVESNPRRPHASSYLLRGLTFLNRKSSVNAYKPSILGRSAGKVFETSAKSLVRVLTPDAVEKHVQQSLTGRINAIVGDTFRESNRRLARKVDFDPADFGYSL